MTTATNDKTQTDARRSIATRWLLGPRHNWTDEHAEQFGRFFPTVAALSEEECAVLRAQHLEMMRCRDRANNAATIAQIRAMGAWWGLGREWMRLVGDVVSYVSGVDR